MSSSPSSLKFGLFHAFLLLLASKLTSSVPVWEGLNGRSSVGLLVPSVTFIEAIGPSTYGDPQTRHLTTFGSGELGNLTAAPNSRAPPLFYINRNQLFQYMNDSAIFPVNVHNITNPAHPPLQMIIGKNREGVTDGTWRWRGSMLYYDLPGGKDNQGVYFSCPTASGFPGLFIFSTPSQPPEGCDPLTLHSFTRVKALTEETKR